MNKKLDYIRRVCSSGNYYAVYPGASTRLVPSRGPKLQGRPAQFAQRALMILRNQNTPNWWHYASEVLRGMEWGRLRFEEIGTTEAEFVALVSNFARRDAFVFMYTPFLEEYDEELRTAIAGEYFVELGVANSLWLPVEVHDRIKVCKGLYLKKQQVAD